MYRIRRFGVVKTATVAAVVYVLLSLIFIVPVLILVALAAPRGTSVGVGGAVVSGLLAVAFYGVIGWIGTAVACVCSNFAAGKVGGIQVEVEVATPATPPPAWGPITTPPADPPPSSQPPA